MREKFKRHLAFGARGIVHKRESLRCWNENEKSLAIELLKSEWHGFEPTFAFEKLKQKKNIIVRRETLRNVMIQAGVWDGKSGKTQIT